MLNVIRLQHRSLICPSEQENLIFKTLRKLWIMKIKKRFKIMQNKVFLLWMNGGNWHSILFNPSSTKYKQFSLVKKSGKNSSISFVCLNFANILINSQSGLNYLQILLHFKPTKDPDDVLRGQISVQIVLSLLVSTWTGSSLFWISFINNIDNVHCRLTKFNVTFHCESLKAGKST